MKKARIAINGFGRIGRLTFRAAWDWPEFDWVLINDPKAGAEGAAHLLTFDSVQGRWPREAVADGADGIRIGEHRLAFTEHAKPGEVDWSAHGVDIVLECSGKFRTPEQLAPYFTRGVKKVIVAAPVKGGDALNIVMGVNDHLYEPARHHLITNASCTTNCLAPVVKVIHEGLGIEHGAITTVHDATNTQTIIDAPHKDLRRARAAGLSLIPTTTGSATAIGLIYPELLGRLNGHAIRVPLLTGSLTDCVFQVKRDTTVEEVNALLRAASETGPLRGILGYETRPLVSIDFKGNPASATIDALSTMVVNKRLVKIYAWYDNEWGYSNRMAELTRKVAAAL
ncbi:Glyceraldehyde-3-phosphate dehydrogenase 3 [Lacunisphaera limnophila]|uniref:Glyceraldehyde-3-phosphate dehydrogenase n=1 Tax=Lacunisphaera limnophila TaxID=1838286 RepID=A0A1D8AS60_9BACT|nr:ArsJ-associated glyceraldehyde-3-phosphate dehydrogenase [Lacunisphaera limnophila]AOS43735.1 Glyceraldehyde-3-phosphate dehydrogenase 3 [Lacunisphaera limnophila]